MAVSVESTKWDSNMIIKVVQKKKINNNTNNHSNRRVYLHAADLQIDG